MTDAQLLVAIKCYREAYFAHATWCMRARADHERARAKPDFDPDAEDENDGRDEVRRLHQAMADARDALVEGPPVEFTALCAAMIAEFGD